MWLAWGPMEPVPRTMLYLYRALQGPWGTYGISLNIPMEPVPMTMIYLYWGPGALHGAHGGLRRHREYPTRGRPDNGKTRQGNDQPTYPICLPWGGRGPLGDLGAGKTPDTQMSGRHPKCQADTQLPGRHPILDNAPDMQQCPKYATMPKVGCLPAASRALGPWALGP